MPLQPGTRLGPYEVLSLIGVGGMGEVYRARDTRLDRTVAVKVLAPGLAGDAEFQTRFTREAKAISALNHPDICSLYDIGREHVISNTPTSGGRAAGAGRAPDNRSPHAFGEERRPCRIVAPIADEDGRHLGVEVGAVYGS